MARTKILITGGAGTLGKAIVRRARRDSWESDFTIFSRDPVKHQQMAREFPECHFVLGDVCDERAVHFAVAGHDIVIHAAAQKHIPEGERDPVDCFHTNVIGSHTVATACARHGVEQMIAISTDKVCRPVNVYGLTKMAMERILLHLAGLGYSTKFNLLRYGNVLGSTGSVVSEWRRMAKEDGIVHATDADMSRFWLTTERAIDLIELASRQPSGSILVPLLPKLSMSKMAQYVVPGAMMVYTGLRPGEKRHEELLTPIEAHFAEPMVELGPMNCGLVRLWPVTGKPREDGHHLLRFMNAEGGWQSDNAPDIPEDVFADMVKTS